MNKYLLLLFSISLALTSCKEKSHEKHMHQDHDASDATEVSENQVLYNEVMKIHDEVMPEMETIYKKRKELKEKLASGSLSAEDKKMVESRLNKLDSADKAMMTWMHEFKPIPDSEGEEKAREYLENEIEKIKKVRETMLSALKDTVNN